MEDPARIDITNNICCSNVLSSTYIPILVKIEKKSKNVIGFDNPMKKCTKKGGTLSTAASPFTFGEDTLLLTILIPTIKNKIPVSPLIIYMCLFTKSSIKLIPKIAKKKNKLNLM